MLMLPDPMLPQSGVTETCAYLRDPDCNTTVDQSVEAAWSKNPDNAFADCNSDPVFSRWCPAVVMGEVESQKMIVTLTRRIVLIPNPR